MNARQLEHVKEMLCDELAEITDKGEITRSDLEDVHILTDTIKNINKIIMLEDNYGGEWTATGSYGNERRMMRTGRKGYYTD